MRSWFFRLLVRWRLFWDLCPACCSDAPEIDTCWVCGGSREWPLSAETKQEYRRRMGVA